jgi:hypothetical protein
LARKQRLQTFSTVVDHAPESPEDIDQRACDNAQAKGLNDVEEASPLKIGSVGSSRQDEL